MTQARPSHRAFDLLGRAPGAGARGVRGRRDDHRRRLRGAAGRARADRVREGLEPARPPCADRPSGADRHRHRHPADGQLRVGVAARGAREQRDRDDEHPHRLLGPGLAGPPVHLQELGLLLRLRAGRPRLLPRGHAAPASAANAARARHRRGGDRGCGVRREALRDGGHDPALRERPRARTSIPRSRACSTCRPCRWSSDSTPGSSSSTRTMWSTPSSTASSTTRPASSTSRPTASCR